ncbi:unnamed protein product, partial [Scytosiphon promiscuus]
AGVSFVKFVSPQTPASSRCLFVNFVLSSLARILPRDAGAVCSDTLARFGEFCISPQALACRLGLFVRTFDSFASFRLDISVGVSPFVRYLGLTLPAVASPPSPRYAR